jgi:hypothetical protein
MRYPQVVVYETDGRLAALLRPLAEERRWALREPRHPGACRRLLAGLVPTVLVVKVGRDLERELALLEEVSWTTPEVPTVLVGDPDHARLAGLAWDLAAACVLLLPWAREVLPEVVAGLMPLPSERTKGERQHEDLP